MIRIGRYNRMRVEKFVAFGAYLSDGKQRDEMILLPKKYFPDHIEIDDELEVFVYRDSKDRPVATTWRPYAQVGEFAALKVVDANCVGAFMDWGLEKDLMVPFREQLSRMKVGKYYLVKVLYDDVTGRIIASSRIGNLLKGNDVHDLQVGEEVRLLVWEKSRLGYKVLINEKYIGQIYDTEIFQQLRIGDRLPGFVSRIRNDNRADIRLRAAGYQGIIGESAAILEVLEENGGFLPLNAKSDPEAIQAYFSMSKRVFKQLIGNLYKERKITVAEDGIRLVK